MGSINSRLPLPLPAYNPGKAAIERLTQLLAVELGRHGIRVNSVAPTYVMTPPLRAKVEAGQRDLGKIMGVHALNRLPEPADIAAAIAFLCSDQAKAITGVLSPSTPAGSPPSATAPTPAACRGRSNRHGRE